MKKRIVLLTKSKKYHNFCVAGIDQETGNWIRLISEDSSIHNAVTKEDMTYENGSEAEILDIIDVVLKRHSPNYYQPENYIFDSSHYWNKVGQATTKQVLGSVKQKDDKFIFHDAGKRLDKAFVENIPENKRYSLKLIVPEYTHFQAKLWPGEEKLDYSVCFSYNNYEYRYLKVTDEQFNSKYMNEGTYSLSNIAFVISLADLNPDDYRHYKLIASILRI